MNVITWTKVAAGHYVSQHGDNVVKNGRSWQWVGAGVAAGTVIDTFPTLKAAQERIAQVEVETFGDTAALAQVPYSGAPVAAHAPSIGDVVTVQHVAGIPESLYGAQGIVVEVEPSIRIEVAHGATYGPFDPSALIIAQPLDLAGGAVPAPSLMHEGSTDLYPATLPAESVAEARTATGPGARMTLTGKRAHRTFRKAERKNQRAARRKSRV